MVVCLTLVAKEAPIRHAATPLYAQALRRRLSTTGHVGGAQLPWLAGHQPTAGRVNAMTFIKRARPRLK